jgi:hypothetical protein
MRLRFSGATLVEENDAVFLWVEELGVGFGGFAARSAVEVDHYNMLLVHLVACIG